jgi:hypothetical protein
MMCGTVENLAEVMEGNGGGLPKWWEKVAHRRMCSIFRVFFARQLAGTARESLQSQ